MADSTHSSEQDSGKSTEKSRQRKKFNETIENILRNSDARRMKGPKGEKNLESDPDAVPPSKSKAATNLLQRFELADESGDLVKERANYSETSNTVLAAAETDEDRMSSLTDVNSLKSSSNVRVPLSKPPRSGMMRTSSPLESGERGRTPEVTPRRNERNQGTPGSLRSTPSNILDDDLGSERSFSSSRVGTPRKRLNSILGGNTSPELRSYIIEKEVVESQLRKLQVEVTSLQTENKLLKEKYNRATAQIVNLERQLADARLRMEQTEDDLSAEITSFRKKSKTEAESEKQDLLKRVASVTKENEILTAENSSLEKQLDAARKTSDIVRQASDKSKIVAAYKAESTSLRDELGKVKLLLHQSDKQRQDEDEKRKEVLQQVAKLTEMNNLLKQQLELGGTGMVAEKQVKSLDVRLKITEERLHQERADRSVKLSEVEDKLISENAKFQVAAKESKRQLHREKEKVKHLEQKLNFLKEQLKLYGAGDDYGSPSRTNLNKKDGSFENIPYSNEVEHKKDLSTEKKQYEDKFTKLSEELEDKTREMQEMEMALKHQINSLVKEKHATITKARNLEDQVAGLQAENDSLKGSLDHRISGAVKTDSAGTGHSEAQLQVLKGEIRLLEGKISHQLRTIKLLEVEKETISTQLDAKEQSLEEALQELENYGKSQVHGDENNDRKQQKIDRLTVEYHSVQSELHEWQKKHRHLAAEKQQLQEQVEKLKKELTRSKQNWENQSAETAESFKIELQNEVHEKEMQILNLKSQFMQNEDELQVAKQELILEQDNTAQLENKLKMMEGELDKEKAAKIRLEREIQQKAELITEQQNELLQEGKKVSSLSTDNRSKIDHLESLERQIQSAESQKEKYQQELTRANVSIENTLRENSNLLNEVRGLKQELMQEKSNLVHVSSEKATVEQKNKLLQEEKSSLQLSVQHLEEDLSKRELHMTDMIHKLEQEAAREKYNYHAKFETLSLDGKRVVTEMEALKQLLEAKENEIERLSTKISHQKQESESLNRQIEKLREESISKTEEIEKLSFGLEQRFQEMSSASEENQQLTSERTKMQIEKYQVEKELSKEKERLEEKRLELAEVTRKLETEEDRHKVTEEMLNQKENHVVTLETEVHRMCKKVAQLEEENMHLKEESKKWTTANASLEKKLNAAKLESVDAHSSASQLRHEHGVTSKQLDAVKHEYDLTMVTLEAEKNTVSRLKEQKRADEMKMRKLEDDLRGVNERIDILNGQLSASRDMVEQLKGDKQSLYADLQELCQKLSEKDELIGQLQEKCTETVETVHNEYALEKVKISRQKESIEDELKRTKFELQELQERLKQKDIQMNTYGRTLLDLEGETKSRQQLENKTRALETEVQELKQLNNSLRADKVSLGESNKHLQDTLDSARLKISKLKDNISALQEKLQNQTDDLRKTIAENNTRHEGERSELKERCSKATSVVKTLEVSLSAANETKEHYLNNNRHMEKTIESLKSQLHEEITLKKLSEQRIDNYRAQLEDVKKRKISDEQMNFDLQQKLNQTERELDSLQEKLKKCQDDLYTLETTAQAHEARAQTLLDQFNALQVEYNTLRQQYDNQKQNLSGKHKKTSLELKKQIEQYMSEKNKLILQVQQLTDNLEQARDLVAIKNKENLKMHEEHLSLEEKFREANSQLRQLQDLVQVEAETREKLDKRNHDLENDLMKLRLVVGKLDQDGENPRETGMDSNAKEEIIRMLQELSLQIHMHQDTRNQTTDNDKDNQLMDMYKNKIDGTEMELMSERAMHSLTKAQLRSLEEDNQRLRIQIAQLKKTKNSTLGKSNRTHLEEINEIIARSQTKAKAMLQTGEFPLGMTGKDGDNTIMGSTYPGFEYLSQTGGFDRGQSPLNNSFKTDMSPRHTYEQN